MYTRWLKYLTICPFYQLSSLWKLEAAQNHSGWLYRPAFKKTLAVRLLSLFSQLSPSLSLFPSLLLISLSSALHYRCDMCKEKFIFTLEDIAKHQSVCSATATPSSGQAGEMDADRATAAAATSSSKTTDKEDSSKGYFCPVCKRSLLLSPIQVLMHRKAHGL